MKTTHTTTAKRGRKHIPHTMRDGTPVPGLRRRHDGRWQIIATGQTFVEPDEHQAVARYYRMTEAKRTETISANLDSDEFAEKLPQLARSPVNLTAEAQVGGWTVSHPADSAILWAWVREMLLKKPEYVALRTGIPQVANLALMDLPTASPKIEALFDAYKRGSGVSAATIRHARAALDVFIKATGAKTLRDLTVERLIVYREQVKASVAPETRRSYFAKVRGVIAYGLKEGINALEIRTTLDRMRVLHSGKQAPRKTDPKPIDPAVFRKLVAGADVELRAYLLLSLNCCMYCSEVLALEWSEIDLDTGALVTDRAKTGLPRAAILWPETIEAIRALGRRGQSPYVFTSTHGTRYNRNGYGEKFARLAKAVGVVVEHNQIRDGSYTSACEQGVEFAACQMLAGHKLPGQSDNYIKRTPGKVKPACDAVYKAYAPFPASTPAIRIGRPRKVPVIPPQPALAA